jgi:hypothetical protein
MRLGSSQEVLGLKAAKSRHQTTSVPGKRLGGDSRGFVGEVRLVKRCVTDVLAK